LVEVPDRHANTLEALVEQYILPGSHIISDGWAAYANLNQIRNGIYMHEVVVHQQNFVDPYCPDVHTNNVENKFKICRCGIAGKAQTQASVRHFKGTFPIVSSRIRVPQ